MWYTRTGLPKACVAPVGGVSVAAVQPVAPSGDRAGGAERSSAAAWGCAAAAAGGLWLATQRSDGQRGGRLQGSARHRPSSGAVSTNLGVELAVFREVEAVLQEMTRAVVLPIGLLRFVGLGIHGQQNGTRRDGTGRDETGQDGTRREETR